MNLLSLRTSEATAGGHAATATAFIEAVAACEFSKATARLAETVTWFGEAIDVESWRARARAALGGESMEAKLSSEVSGAVLCAIPGEVARETLDGPVSGSHSLAVFDFRKGETWVSVGVLTRSDGTVDRVIDLRRLKRHVLAAAA